MGHCPTPAKRCPLASGFSFPTCGSASTASGAQRSSAPATTGVLLFSRINRGPLFLDSVPPLQMREGVLRQLRRRWRFLLRGAMLIAPALEVSEKNWKLMHRCGFIPRKRSGWSSALLDLRQDEDVLHQRLSCNWQRNLKTSLRRIEKCEATISTQSVEWLAKRHDEYQNSKGFHGSTTAFLQYLHRERPDDFLIISAQLDREPVGAIAIVRFGVSAEYYIGWNSERGKQI